LHFTPTSASWMNQVEAFFGLLTRQALRRGSFASVPDLVAAIGRYIAGWNADYHPFAWVRDADQILVKAASRSQPASAAGLRCPPAGCERWAPAGRWSVTGGRMGIVEGEPDHTGLGAWVRALQRLLRRWQRSRRDRDPERDRKAPTPELPNGKKPQGRNTRKANGHDPL
jgi:hypothetical protein